MSTMTREEAVEGLSYFASDFDPYDTAAKRREVANLLADPWLPIDSRGWRSGDQAILKVSHSSGELAVHCRFDAGQVEGPVWWNADDSIDQPVEVFEILGWRPLNLESE